MVETGVNREGPGETENSAAQRERGERGPSRERRSLDDEERTAALRGEEGEEVGTEPPPAPFREAGEKVKLARFCFVRRKTFHEGARSLRFRAFPRLRARKDLGRADTCEGCAGNWSVFPSPNSVASPNGGNCCPIPDSLIPAPNSYIQTQCKRFKNLT